jgi:hypothetical protein
MLNGCSVGANELNRNLFGSTSGLMPETNIQEV